MGIQDVHVHGHAIEICVAPVLRLCVQRLHDLHQLVLDLVLPEKQLEYDPLLLLSVQSHSYAMDYNHKIYGANLAGRMGHMLSFVTLPALGMAFHHAVAKEHLPVDGKELVVAAGIQREAEALHHPLPRGCQTLTAKAGNGIEKGSL